MNNPKQLKYSLFTEQPTPDKQNLSKQNKSHKYQAFHIGVPYHKHSIAMLLASTHQTFKFLFIILLVKPQYSSNIYEETSSSLMKRSLLNPITKVFMNSRKPRSPEHSLPLQLAGGNANWEGQDLSWLSAEALVG